MTGLGSATWGALLHNCNFKDASLQGLDAADTWQTIGSFDFSSTFSTLPYLAPVDGAVTGPYLRPNPAGVAGSPRYIHENELVGGMVRITASGELYKIARNTSGFWTPNTAKQPAIFLDGWDTSEPTTGTMTIIAPSCCILMHGLAQTEYRQWRITIPAQDTVEGYFEVGACVIGPVYVFGQRYSWGRVETLSPNTSLYTDRAGYRYSVVDAPSRRAVSFAWTDPVIENDLYESSLDPDYLTIGTTASSAHAVATRADTHTLLKGLIDRLDGPSVPVVYLPRIKYSSGASAQTITSPEAFVYGRIVSEVSTSVELGNELDSEVRQISEIRIEEEI